MMNNNTNSGFKPAFRIFILGAGFSYPAGLPLANELWSTVYSRQRNNISGSLDRYARFKKKCDGVDIDPESKSFNFEAFMGFLDIEHALWLQGGDTASEEGNGTQLIIRQETGRVLTEHTPSLGNIPDLYLDFAQELGPHDYVLTFNYDILLERALKQVDQNYRLFPFRYSETDDNSGIGCVEEADEVTILKMHGSVDWFSDEEHLRSVEACSPHPPPREHPIFGQNSEIQADRILEKQGQHFKGDPLLHIWCVQDVESIYNSPHASSMCTPWLLPPSTGKILYLRKILPIWHGISQAGGYNLGLSFIGYSLPPHDDYAKLPLFDIAENYQRLNWGKGAFGPNLGGKSPIILIDFHSDKTSQNEYRHRYGFVDPNKARFHFSGFNGEAVELIREMRHIAVKDAK